MWFYVFIQRLEYSKEQLLSIIWLCLFLLYNTCFCYTILTRTCNNNLRKWKWLKFRCPTRHQTRLKSEVLVWSYLAMGIELFHCVCGCSEVSFFYQKLVLQNFWNCSEERLKWFVGRGWKFSVSDFYSRFNIFNLLSLLVFSLHLMHLSLCWRCWHTNPSCFFCAAWILELVFLLF